MVGAEEKGGSRLKGQQPQKDRGIVTSAGAWYNTIAKPNYSVPYLNESLTRAR